MEEAQKAYEKQNENAILTNIEKEWDKFEDKIEEEQEKEQREIYANIPQAWDNERIAFGKRKLIEKKYRASTFGEAIDKVRKDVESVRYAEEYSAADLLKDYGFEYDEKYVNVLYGKPSEITDGGLKANSIPGGNWRNPTVIDPQNILDKIIKSEEKYIVLNTSVVDLAKVCENLPEKFEPVYRENDRILTMTAVNTGTHAWRSSGQYVLVKLSKEVKKDFEEKQAPYELKKKLESAQRILDDPAYPNFLAIPVDEEKVDSYMVTSYNSVLAEEKLEAAVKAYPEKVKSLKEELKENLKKHNDMMATMDQLNASIRAAMNNGSLSASEIRKMERRKKLIDKLRRGVKANLINIGEIEEELKFKRSIKRLEDSLQQKKENANEEDRFDLVHAVGKRATDLGIEFNEFEWFRENSYAAVDIHKSHGVYF